MLVLPCIVIQSRMRRSLIGALSTDPVIHESRHAPRSSLLARLAPSRPGIAATPATARQS
jgi:hypothetical protein